MQIIRDKILTKSYHGAIMIVRSEVVLLTYGLSPSDRKKVEEFIPRMKALLATHEYTIQINEKNREFDKAFPLRDADKWMILKSLVADDCVKVEPNNNPRYPDNEVFVFCKEATVVVYGESEELQLYLKMYIQESKTYDLVIVISFHQAGMFD
jgi:hypothetical protein